MMHTSTKHAPQFPIHPPSHPSLSRPTRSLPGRPARRPPVPPPPAHETLESLTEYHTDQFDTTPPTQTQTSTSIDDSTPLFHPPSSRHNFLPRTPDPALSSAMRTNPASTNPAIRPSSHHQRHRHLHFDHTSSNEDSLNNDYSTDDARSSENDLFQNRTAQTRPRTHPHSQANPEQTDEIQSRSEQPDPTDQQPISSLHPLSSPGFPDAQPLPQRTNSQNSNKRQQYSFRVADAARAAKETFNRRWSFHRRTHTQAAEPPSMNSSTSMQSTPASTTSRQLSHTALPNDRNDFLSPAFASPLIAAIPPHIPLAAQPQTAPLPHLETIDIPVKTWVLQGNGTAPRKSTRFSAWSKKLGPSRTVRVESNPSGLAPIVLYASDQVLTTTRVEPFKTTESITSRPEYVDKQSIVYRDSPFEIGVVGMSISGQDFKLGYPDFNEVLMYSMQREPGEQGEEGDALPYIHYDPTQDDKIRGTEPDQFIPIPASKSLFMASDGDADPTANTRKSVNCRFKVLELDAVDEMMQMSLAGIEQLGNHVQQYSSSAPALGLLSPAISLASMVSKRALESHAKPDKVIMIDMNFLLAERRQPEVGQDGLTEIPFESRSGEYLRYGYYFFLERGVEAKLYASFRTFPNVSLMMKRVDKPGPNEKQFFPLTGVSYLVIRVTPRLSSMRATRRAVRLRHVQKLEQLMKSALLSNMKGFKNEEARAMVGILSDLGEELGITHREDDHEKNDGGIRGGLLASGSTKVGPSSLNINDIRTSRFSDRGRRASLSDWPSGSGLERFSTSLARARAASVGPSASAAERSSSMSTLDSGKRREKLPPLEQPGRPGLPAPRLSSAVRVSSDF